MWARLVSFSSADPEDRERAEQTIRERPSCRHCGENRRAKGILLWETKEAAEGAETQLVERRSKMASSVGLGVESADLYEALVVERE